MKKILIDILLALIFWLGIAFITVYLYTAIRFGFLIVGVKV